MKNSIIAFLIFIFTVTDIYSQLIPDVRSMSMGNTSVAGSYNIGAFSQNPANILSDKFNEKSNIYFNVFLDAGFQLNGDYLSINFYDDYFTKADDGSQRVLSPRDKQTILNEASDQFTNYIANVKFLSVILNTRSVGSFGLSIDERATGNFLPGKDFLELALYGNEVSRTYDFSENSVNQYWIREINLSYAKKFELKNNNTFENIAFGISVKPQFGVYYLNTRQNNLMITTTDSNTVQSSGSAEFYYAGLSDNNELQYSPGNAGFGFGFDAGFNTQIKNFSKNGILNIGLSITDLGYITWNKNTNKYFNDGSFVITDITNQEQIDSLKDVIKSTKTPVPDFTTSLPPVLRAGFTYKFLNKSGNKLTDSTRKEQAVISLDIIQGLSNDLGGITKTMVGIGGEYNATGALSPQAGFTFGGLQDFAMSIGLGINADPVIIDIGTNNILSLFTPRNTTNFSAGLSVKFKVN
ncbi:MAG TPA: DUF5723 family protein [Ignavibacteria bacterium]|nr:DUF5723 family protein [Ignavibacteria bacterium]HMR40710.1 DUF5723 family protein [Ignavibacteria bacterium]